MVSDESKNTFYEFGEFSLFPAERVLLKNGERIPLTPKVFDLLLLLVENQGHLLTKNEILEKVWHDSFVEEGTLARTISTLRKSLGKNSQDFVVTVPKKGYRFIANTKKVLKSDENDDFNESSLPLYANEVSHFRPEISDPPEQNKTKWLTAFGILILAFACGLSLFVWFKRQTASKDSGATETKNEARQLTDSNLDEKFLAWTQDGKILFDRGPSNEIFFINADGTGESRATETIPVLKNGWLSSDKSKAVFQKSGDKAFYLANADGSNEIKLEFSLENMAWSADGKRFVFQGNLDNPPNPNNPEIYIYTLETNKVAQITKNESFDGDPSFSPDGKEIIFASDRDKNLEIYLMNDDGSNARRLTDNPAHDSFPKFTPDGTQVTFTSNRNSETTDVYLMNKDGKNVVRLTDWKSNEISRGGISPDGTKLAFNSNHNGKYQIFVINVEPFAPKVVLTDDNNLQTPDYSPDGTQVVYSVGLSDKTGELRILNLNDGKSRLLLKTSRGNNYPRWSPDGNWIAFHQEVEGKWDVFKIKADGSELTNLTHDPASDSLPNWLPDGKSLIFRTTRNGDSLLGEIYRMNADGSDPLPLKVEKGYLGWSIVSPDGMNLVYSCNRQQLRGGKLDICQANADGSDEKLLLSRPGDNVHSNFSPDGKRIAFVANSDGNSEIYIMNSDGTNLLRLTRNAATDSNPTFSPDGKKIIFSSNRGGNFALYSIELAEN